MPQYYWFILFGVVVVFVVICVIRHNQKVQAQVVLRARHLAQERRLHESLTELRCLRWAIHGSQNLETPVPNHLQCLETQALLLTHMVQWFQSVLPLSTDSHNDLSTLDGVQKEIMTLWETYHASDNSSQSK